MASIIQNFLIFQKLNNYTPQQIYKVLNEEPPQIIAAIVARLTSEKARDVLKEFPSAEQKDITFRIAKGTPVPPEILQTTASTLQQKLAVFDEQPGAATGGSEQLAKILNKMGTSAQQALLDNLRSKDSSLASKVKDEMFSFSDILYVNDDGLRKAMVEISDKILALALKGTDDQFKEKFYSNVSSNRRAILQEEYIALGKVKRRDVDAAQTKVLDIIKKYEAEGAIYIKRTDTDDEWV